VRSQRACTPMEPVSPSTKGLRSALPMLFLLQRVVRGAGWRGCLLCAGTAWCLGERALRRCGKPNTFAGITAPHQHALSWKGWVYVHFSKARSISCKRGSGLYEQQLG